MTSRRDHSRAASLCLRVAMSLATFSATLGCGQGSSLLREGCCQRAVFAALVPKLDLRWQLRRAQMRDDDEGARIDAGFAAWLRWQPTSYAAEVPSRYELSPSAWAYPCELDDITCFAELAESERELAEAVQEER